jgi:hypothetical protein
MAPSARRKMKRHYAKRIVHGDDGAVSVISRKRRVTITIQGWLGKIPSIASLKLTPKAVDKLIARLHNIRASSHRPKLREDGLQPIEHAYKNNISTSVSR